MAKKNKKKPLEKFAFGSMIENPNTALAENNIMMANAMAKAQGNGFTQFLDTFGTISQQVGSSLMSQGAGSITEDSGGLEKFLSKNQGSMEGALGALKVFENGGMIQDRVVEVEGDEVVETPDGDLLEFEGPSHEEGGIKTSLPVGTQVYSDIIQVNGKSMADRKKKREREEAKARKLYETSKDSVAKSTLERILHGNKIQEEKDNLAQEVIDNAEKQKNTPIEKFANGGPILPMMLQLALSNPDIYKNINLEDTDFEDDSTVNLQTATVKSRGKQQVGLPDIGSLMSGIGNTDSFHTGNNEIDYINDEDFFDRLKSNAPKFTNQSTYEPVNLPPSVPNQQVAGLPAEEISEPSGEGFNFDFDLNSIMGAATSGDLMGMLGNLKQVQGARNNTLKERQANLPNQTFYDDYGNEALDTMEGVKDGFRNSLDQYNQDLELSRTSSINRNNNSARGINTARALNIATDNSIDANKAKGYDAFMKMMADADGKIAATQLNIDGTKRKDQATKYEADQKDIAAFYENMKTNDINEGKLISSFGQVKNKWQSDSAYAKMFEKMFPNFKGNTTTGDITGVATTNEEIDYKTPDYNKTEDANSDQGIISLLDKIEQIYQGKSKVTTKKTTKKKK